VSIENAKQLIARLREDSALKHKLHDAGPAGFEAIATEVGLPCTADEMQQAIQESAGELELTDEDLEKVAGGAVTIFSVAIV